MLDFVGVGGEPRSHIEKRKPFGSFEVSLQAAGFSQINAQSRLARDDVPSVRLSPSLSFNLVLVTPPVTFDSSRWHRRKPIVLSTEPKRDPA
jgi:hypothetical protein